MISIVSTIWNSSWASSRKTIQEKIFPKRVYYPWTSYRSLLAIWLGRTQISRKKSISYQNLLITAHTIQKIVTYGFWSQLASIEVEEYRYSIQLNSSRRYYLTIFCLWIVKSSRREDNKRRNKKKKKKDKKMIKVKRTNKKIKTSTKIKLNKKKRLINRANKTINRRCLHQKN